MKSRASMFSSRSMHATLPATLVTVMQPTGRCLKLLHCNALVIFQVATFRPGVANGTFGIVYVTQIACDSCKAYGLNSDTAILHINTAKLNCV